MTKERMPPSAPLNCGFRPVKDMSQWQMMPKLELHAHLNGCVRISTLLELAEERSRNGDVLDVDIENIMFEEDRSLPKCFRVFPLIHALTTDHTIVTRITKEAIEDFVADNVVYLEIRTTPKCNETYGMSKRSYVEAVLAGFEAAGVSPILKRGDNDDNHTTSGYDFANNWDTARSHKEDKPPVYVRLLLSIDRRETAEAAMDTVMLAWEMRNRGVVGIDLSGDPRLGQWQTFLPALIWAKEHGLPLTLHCGEIFNPEEVRAMLSLRPERLGHVTCLDKPEWNALLESGIPVEICLTSNLRTRSVRSIFEHHFVALNEAKHPTVLCTDDPGVFSTCLSNEYSLAANCLGLSDMDLLIMAKTAINYSFAEDSLKEVLREIFETALQAEEKKIS